jgi:hypothetical protein
MYKREEQIKLQYLRPQIEVFAAACHQFMDTSYSGGAGEGDNDEDDNIIEDAKKMDHDFSYDMWEEEMWEE